MKYGKLTICLIILLLSNLLLAHKATANDCESAHVLSEGENAISINEAGTHYFAFTVPSGDSKVLFDFNEEVSLYVSSGDCDGLSSIDTGFENIMVSTLGQGETYILTVDFENAPIELTPSISVLPLEPGDNCGVAITASIGTTTVAATTLKSTWYSFTRSSDPDKRVVMSAGDGQYIRAWGGNCDNLTYLDFRVNEDMVLSDLEAGETILFETSRRSTETELTIAEVDLVEGDNCENPISLSIGTTTVSASASSTWYTYTRSSESNKKVQITLSDENRIIWARTGACDGLDYLDVKQGSLTLPNLMPGEVLYLEVYEGQEDIDLSISEFDLEEGDNCSLAIPIEEGEHTFTFSPSQPALWYSLVASSDGVLTLDQDSNIEIHIYRGSCDDLDWIGGNFGDASASVEAGEDIYIRLEGSSSYDFVIEIVPPEPGETCNAAIPLANNLDISVEINSENDKWYSFTRSSDLDKKVVINTSGGNVQIVAYEGDCDDLDFFNSQENSMTLSDLLPGQTVYIRVNADNQSAVLNAGEQDLQDGDNCSLAIPIEEGEHTFTFSPSQPTLWYSLVASSDGNLIVDQDAGIEVDIYRGSCDFLNWIGGNFGDASASVESGEDIFIRLEGSSSYDFVIEIVPPEPGESCESAIELLTGANEIVPGDFNQIWASYAVDIDVPSQVMINIDNPEVYTEVFSGNCDVFHEFLAGGYSELLIPEVSNGQNLFIRMYSYNAEAPFQLSIATSPLQPGDICSLAEEVTANQIDVPEEQASGYWLSYVMPESGKKLRVIASENALIAAFLSCSEAFPEELENNELELGGLFAGTELFIYTEGYEEIAYSLSFELVDYEAGELCTNAIEASLGMNENEGLDTSLDYWFTYTMDLSKRLTVNAPNTTFRVYSGDCSGYYSIGNDNSFSGIQNDPGSDGIIKVANPRSANILIRFSQFEEDFTFHLTESELTPGDWCGDALVAQLGNNTIPEELIKDAVWYRYTIESEDSYYYIEREGFSFFTVYQVYGDCSNSANIKLLGTPSGDFLVKEDFQVGDEILIRWANLNEGVSDWTLAEVPRMIGDACDNPMVAMEGENTIQADQDVVWFAYTIQSSGSKVTVSSDNSSFEDYKSCDAFFNYDWWDAVSGNEIVVGRHEGEELLIRFVPYEDELNFTITEEPFLDCQEAMTATEGMNQVPSNEDINEPIWFRYTFEKAHQQLAFSSSNNEYAMVLTGECDQLEATHFISSNGVLVGNDFDIGESIYIVWRYSEGDFSFEIETSDELDGSTCSSALIANVGENTYDLSDYTESFWVKYTVLESDKNVVVKSSRPYDYISLAENCEGGYSYVGYDGEVSFPGPEQGDEIWIRISAYNDQEVTLTITEEDLMEGQSCGNPVAISQGIVEVPYREGFNKYWMGYTFQNEGYIELRKYNSPTFIEILTGDCENQEYIGSEFSSAFQAGELIYVTTSSSLFSFELIEHPLEGGIQCSDPFTAVLGENSVPASNYPGAWFSYTMATDQNLSVSTTGNPFNLVGKYQVSGCGEEYAKTGFYGEDFIISNLKTGDEVLLWFEKAPEASFTFDLAEVATDIGDECNQPNVATLGLNVATSGYQWYSFVPQHSGEYVLDSEGADVDSKVSVYDGCEGMLLISNDNYQGSFQSQATIELTSNQTYVIVWESNRASFSYNWSLKRKQEITIDPIPSKSTDDDSFEISWSTNSGETASAYIISGPALLLGNLVTLSGEPGIVTVGVSNLGSSEYTSASSTASFAVTSPELISQSISFEAIANRTILDAPLELSATSDSGLEVGFSIVSGPASLVGTTLYPEGLGEISVRAFQFGNETTNPAEPVTRTFEVTRVPQTISFSAIEDKENDANPFNINVSATSGLEVALAIDGPATLDGFTVTLTGNEGTVTITATQDGDEIYAAAAVVQVSFEVEQPLGLSNAVAVEVYPNPAADHVSITSSNWKEVGELMLLDISGVLIRRIRLQGQTTLVSTKELSSGIYVLKAANELQHSSLTCRLIIRN